MKIWIYKEIEIVPEIGNNVGKYKKLFLHYLNTFNLIIENKNIKNILSLILSLSKCMTRRKKQRFSIVSS